MSAKEFHPVVPNITDDNMINAHGTPMPDPESGPQQQKQQQQPQPQPQPKKSFGKIVVISILIVIIIVLLLLLIYQIYKYCSTDDIVDVNTKNDKPHKNGYAKNESAEYNKTNKETRDARDAVRQFNSLKTNTTANTNTGASQTLPTFVSNTDNSVLSQFIQKNKNTQSQKNTSNGKTSARVISHNTSLQAISEESDRDEKTRDEKNRIAVIIDNAMESQTDLTHTDDITPDTDDLVNGMRDDMESDKKNSAYVQMMGNDPDTLIDDFTNSMSGYDVDVDDDADGGDGGDGDDASYSDDPPVNDICSFILTRGTNTGNKCGRASSSKNRCTRHLNK
jgi:cell division protein FtsL